MNDINDIIERLSTAEIDSVINIMVNNFDLTGKYYNQKDYYIYSCNPISFFKKYFSITPELIELIDRIASKKVKEKDRHNRIILLTPTEEEIAHRKHKIYLSVIDYIVSKAKQISDNREHLRIPMGSYVDYDKCTSHNSYIGKIEFYKDGGWGIGNENGLVIVKNHLTRQPSQISPLINDGFCPYRIIQDRDTKKYGVLSYASFIETIHCLYDKIEIVEFYRNSIRHYYIKVNKNEKWGCFDENCALIIDCKYDDIQLTNNFLECTRDGEYVFYDTLDEKGYDSILVGKKDLYNSEGVLLLGGFDELEIRYDYFQFYFGTRYEHCYVEETDYRGFSYKLSKLSLNYESSLCLILDENFKTIMRYDNGFYKMPKGHIINSIDELMKIVPSELLLKYRIDLSHINIGFIYLHNYHGEQYIVPNYVTKGYGSPEEMDINQLVKDTNDLFIEDKIVTILKLNKKREIIWEERVNEIDSRNYDFFVYRKGKKCGFYNEKGLGKCEFDAIARGYIDNKIYVAKCIYGIHECKQIQENPNYSYISKAVIRYFSMDYDGKTTQIKDDWNLFDPTTVNWFPSSFIDNHYVYDPGEYFCDSYKIGNEWTDEELKDAADIAYDGHSRLSLGLED